MNTPASPAGLTTVCLWLLISVRSLFFWADSSQQQTQRGSRILHTCHAFILTRFTRPSECYKPLPIRWAKQLYHPLHYQQWVQRCSLSNKGKIHREVMSLWNILTDNKPRLTEQLVCSLCCPAMLCMSILLQKLFQSTAILYAVINLFLELTVLEVVMQCCFSLHDIQILYVETKFNKRTS